MAEATHLLGLPLKHLIAKHMADVLISSPADGQVLTYVAADGKWENKAPSGGGGTHNLLSTTHPDTLPASVVIGDMIYGNSTPLWARLPKGSQNQVLAMGASLPGWATETLLSVLHSDTSAGTAVAGDLIAANSVPKWARLPIGSSGQVLTVVSGAPAWAALPTIGQGFKAYLGSNQTGFGSGSLTQVNLNTTLFDTYSEWDKSNCWWTPTVTGLYLAMAVVTLTSCPTACDGMNFWVGISKSTGSPNVLQTNYLPRVTAANNVAITFALTAQFAASTHYCLFANQNSGQTLTIGGGINFTALSIIRLF
jgi:hypothetical protein